MKLIKEPIEFFTSPQIKRLGFQGNFQFSYIKQIRKIVPKKKLFITIYEIISFFKKRKNHFGLL